VSKKKSVERERPRLTMSRENAAEELDERIRVGREMRTQLDPANLMAGNRLDGAEAEMKRWDRFNSELLHSMFTTDRVANSYFYAAPHRMRSVYGERADIRYIQLLEGYDKRIAELGLIKEKLRLYEFEGRVSVAPVGPPAAAPRFRDVHIHVQGSTIGQLNMGEVVGNIETNLKAVTGPSAEELAQVLKSLVEAIAADGALPDDAKREALQNIDVLASAAAQAPARRAIGPVKAVLTATGALLAAGSSAVSIWQAAEPLLRAHFGI
jgi:hypothetical protein